MPDPRVESEIIYQSLAVDEGASFAGLARPSPNPLAEDFAVSPLPEAREWIGEPDTAGANGTDADRATAGRPEPLVPSEGPRQLPAAAAMAQHS
jgi:hypothetical protein